MYPMSTYSITAYDPCTGELGVAVQSKFLAVGSLVPWVESGVGAIATQAKTNSNFGQKSFELLKSGMDVKDILKELIKDDKDKDIRQFGLIDSKGNAVAYTGKGCFKWAGHIVGKNYTCQGNVLLGDSVIKAIALGFERSKGDLADKLLAAIKSGQDAGGERRGQQSAALLIKRVNPDSLGEKDIHIDLRVDDHPSPIGELNRLLQCHRIEFAKNHRDKYYKLEGETRYKLIDILQKINLIGGTLIDGEGVEDVLNRYAKNINIKDALKDNQISGELVDNLVDRYYNLSL